MTTTTGEWMVKTVMMKLEGEMKKEQLAEVFSEQ